MPKDSDATREAEHGSYSVEAVRNHYAKKRAAAERFAGTVGALTFLGSWAYCTSKYGFLFGFALGWLPSIILAVIVGLFVFAMAKEQI